jgi:hypothetical protein
MIAASTGAIAYACHVSIVTLLHKFQGGSIVESNGASCNELANSVFVLALEEAAFVTRCTRAMSFASILPMLP